MKLNHLRNVVAVAARGSLRGAARSLGLSQPAISRSIAEIEHELGTPLFERRSRGTVLTEAGEAFVRRANAILAEAKRAKEEVAQIKGGKGGNVTAGLSIAAHIAMLPQALDPFRRRFPQVRLRLIEGLYPTLEKQLIDGSMDFWIGPMPSQPISAELRAERLFQGARVIMARKGHRLAGAKSLKELTDAEWIMTSITHLAEEEMDEMFAHYRLPPPKIAVQSQSALTLMTVLSCSDLLAMVPRHWADFAARQGQLVPIEVKERLPAPAVVLIRRASLSLTPAAQCLVDHLCKNLTKPRK